jgi:type IV secretory pathway VirB2 component (pilin)
MKKLLKVLPVMFVLSLVLTNVFALANVTMPAGNASNTVNVLTGNIWATVSVVIYVLAIAAIVIAGLRYMFASADQKADIKKSTGILIIGAILVFGATLVLNLVKGTVVDLTNGVTAQQVIEVIEEVA